MNDKDENKQKQTRLDELISLREASDLSGLSQGHLSHLIRQSDLWGRKIGRNWVTTTKAMKEYLAHERRPGPKSKKET